MSKCGYAISTEGEVALTATTARSVLGVRAGSAVGIDLQAIEVDFDGVTSSAEPVLCELCYATFATNAPGTNSTGTSERQLYGRAVTADFTGAHSWTTEPTVLTVLKPWALDPNKGLFLREFSLGKTFDSAVSEGFVLRLTAPANVGCRAYMELEHA
jgi:hypothetical protein